VNAGFSVLKREEGAVTVVFKVSVASSDVVVTAGFSVLRIEDIVVDTIRDSSVNKEEARSPEASVSVEVESAAMSGSVLDPNKGGRDSTAVFCDIVGSSSVLALDDMGVTGDVCVNISGVPSPDPPSSVTVRPGLMSVFSVIGETDDFSV